jgi:hypothetical protein
LEVASSDKQTSIYLTNLGVFVVNQELSLGLSYL